MLHLFERNLKMPISFPSSISRITSHLKRRAPLFGFGIEHIPFLILYAITIKYCMSTAGAPYEASLNHHKALYAASLDAEDLWELEGDEDILAILRDREVPLPNPSLPSFWSLLAIALVFIFHSLLWFVQRWTAIFKCFVKYSNLDIMQPGCHLFVRPHAHQGSSEIVPVEIMNLEDGSSMYCFTFQRQKFEVDMDKQEVRELTCPVNLSLATYFNSKGQENDRTVASAVQRYGDNSFDIPMPTFKDIYIKQILGPIPVFQFFCASLWLLDEYWYFALFNIFSIFMFEATTSFGRLKNVSTLRGMGVKSTMVLTRRGGVWKDISTKELVPGDLISLKKENEKDDIVVPCDSVVVAGSAVLNEATLTGESTPQMKEAIMVQGAAANEKLSIEKNHRVNVLYSGTTLMQQSGPSEDCAERHKPPNKGVVCYVLRTGFSSSQGKLVRMIEYSSEQVMPDVKETLALLFLLLCFALLASGYVLKTGLTEGKRSQYELVLRCVLILTAVVPPELPMQTAVAVNTALMALWKAQVFCTEPFRIPYAGRLNYTLFDKTGTLTTDQLTAVGTVCYNDGDNIKDKTPQDMKFSSAEVCYVLGGAHSLVEVNGILAGDPIETAAIKAIGWEYNPSTQTSAPKVVEGVKPSGLQVKLKNRYHFVSALQRMSSVATVFRAGSTKGEMMALVKGSPETIGTLLVKKPYGYDEAYFNMAHNGMRVLALAYRKLSPSEYDYVNNYHQGLAREDVEKDLIFCGFVAFSCLIRKDTAMIIKELQAGNLTVAMATGDADLTALYVGGAVGITGSSEKALKLNVNNSKELYWTNMTERRVGGKEVQIPFDINKLPSLKAEKYDLCINGPVLRSASEIEPKLWDVIEHFAIFARMAPDDKERVLRALKERGFYTLMCGDGANDVGALKQAHVGLALLGGFGGANTAKLGDNLKQEETEEEKKIQAALTNSKNKERNLKLAERTKKDNEEIKKLQMQWMEEELQKLNREKGESAWNAFTAMKNSTARMMEENKKRLAERQKLFGGGPSIADQAALLAQDGDTGEVPMVKLGDASVAAPFTSKLPSIKSTVDIIRQGRCTLVSTIQMQQILALNCLIAAYSLSALYLDGVRSGEKQMIASGMCLTVASIAFSFARPVMELSPVRPITSIFHPSISLSIVGQLLIHLYCMVASINMAKMIEPLPERKIIDFSLAALAAVNEAKKVAPVLDEWGDVKRPPFTPTLLNTVVFLIETAQQVSVMAVNYKGRPFMLASTENPAMLYSLLACCTGVFLCAFEAIPMLNEYLELVPLPSDEFRNTLLQTLGLSVFGSFLWDRIITAIFTPKLVWVGYVDAYKAFKNGNMLGFWRNVGIGLVFLAIFGITDNILIAGGAFWMYRRYTNSQKELEEKKLLELADLKKKEKEGNIQHLD